MIAANGDGAGVADHAAAEDDQFGGAAADVQQAAAEVALVLRQARFRGGERLEHGVTDEDAGAVCGGDKILRRGEPEEVTMWTLASSLLADHADRVANAFLRDPRRIHAEGRGGLRGPREA